ncbi:MAG: hypothetical protein VW686_09925 [Luminiphilus sp.]
MLGPLLQVILRGREALEEAVLVATVLPLEQARLTLVAAVAAVVYKATPLGAQAVLGL